MIREIDGISDINVEKVTGLAQVQVDYNRDRLAQYGLSVGDANRILRVAFAGSQAGVVYDGEKRFGLIVRLEKDYRQSLEDVKNLSVALPNGAQIPFEQVADISIRSGPAQVSRENTKRRITIGFNVRGRDIQSTIKEVTSRMEEKIKLPPGYFVTYGGQFKNMEAASRRLMLAVPLALLMIFLLLFFTFHSVKQALLIYSAVPLSAIGGILALWIRGMNFSISAGVGFIALFGVAVLNGIVLVAEFNRLEMEGITDVKERVLKGLRSRLRPVVLTASVASLGFLPMALSGSAGAEVQKPLATVVIGGLITATFLTLVILPVFYVILSSRHFSFRPAGKAGPFVVTLLFTTVGSFGWGGVRAQPNHPIKLHEAIQMALDSNLSVRSTTYSVDVQKALKGTSWDLPKISIDGQYGQINSNSKDNSFSISQSFAFPSVYINQNKLATEGIKNSEWQLKATQMEIATQVKQIYWQLAYLHSKFKLWKYQDSLYAGFQRAAELRAKAGETNRLEMITARSQSLEIKNQLSQIRADLGIYSRQLQMLLNSGMPVFPSDTVLHRIEFIPVSDRSALLSNPFMHQVNQQVEIVRLKKKLEQSRAWPDFKIGYFSQTMQGIQDVNGLPHKFGTGDRFTGIQAGIEIPLWFSPYNSKMKAAKLLEQIAISDATHYSRTLEGQYRSLLDEFEKFKSSVDYYENQAVPEAVLIIDQSTRSYKAGALDYLDYVLSLSRALTIRQNYLEVLNNYNQTIINIEFITGKIF